MNARAYVLGWLGAAATAAVLLTGVAALALTARPVAPLLLDLGQVLPTAPALAAIAEVAPQSVDSGATLSRADQMPKPPRLPDRLPPPKVPTQSDLAVPVQKPPPDTAPKAKPAVKAAEPKSATPKAAKTEPTKAQTEKPRKSAAADKKAGLPAASNGSSAPQQGQKAKGGAPKVSPAAYARAVLKKVRATPKQSVTSKGVAVVGFTVARDGGLAGAKIIRSSGDAALDAVALRHIQRSAPFPVPPDGVSRSFSFEFVGR